MDIGEGPINENIWGRAIPASGKCTGIILFIFLPQFMMFVATVSKIIFLCNRLSNQIFIINPTV